jgi:ATPase subunit of ABC transporter with duplicated ATPase domains
MTTKDPGLAWLELEEETVDCLIEALKNYRGGVLVITHEKELIERLDAKILYL